MDYKKLYVDYLKQHIAVKNPLTVVFDASNGPAGAIVKDLCVDALASSVVIHDDIDPDFKAHGPNPLIAGATESCAKTVLENKAVLGILFDADGDRAIFLDDTGAVIPACFISLLLFKQYQAPYVVDELVYQSLMKMPDDKLPATSTIVPSQIGGFNVKNTMQKNQAELGVEYSGHYYFKDFFGADSGILTAIKVLNTLSTMTQSLSDWRRTFGIVALDNFDMSIEGKNPADIYKKIETHYKDSLEKIENRDGYSFIFPTYWINIRPSNTEPLLRFVVGGAIDSKKIIAELKSLV